MILAGIFSSFLCLDGGCVSIFLRNFPILLRTAINFIISCMPLGINLLRATAKDCLLEIKKKMVSILI
jgi:hypothetical protein